MTEKHAAWNDPEREEGTIERVEGPHNGWYQVTSSNGWSCGVSEEYGVVPKVSDPFVTWGSFGRPIRGQAIGYVVLYYRTPAEQDVENAKAAEKIRADKVAEYEGKRTEFETRVAALPDKLRERIEGFRSFKGEGWRHEFEPYELFCCEEAVKIHAAFPSVEQIQAFSKMEYAAQKAAFPALSTEHSGNTFSMSVRLAFHLTNNPDLLPKEHGALCALVGCEDYGCYASRSGAPTA